MSNKTFTVAGESILKGQHKFRFANDLASRIKVLVANGHTDITLLEIRDYDEQCNFTGDIIPMTKENAQSWFETYKATKALYERNPAEQPEVATIEPAEQPEVATTEQPEVVEKPKAKKSKAKAKPVEVVQEEDEFAHNDSAILDRLFEEELDEEFA